MRYAPLALILLVTLSAHTCNEKTAAAAGDGDVAAGAARITGIMDGKWVARTLKGNAFTMPDGETAPWLRLLKDGGKIEGYGGCNSLMGTFTLDGDRVEFPGVGSTKKYCANTQATENAFVSALRATKKFKMEGEVLQFTDDVGADLVSFSQE